MMRLIAVTGRFQPLHNDHLELLQIALGLAAQVLIGITNATPIEYRSHPSNPHRHLLSANPYTFEQREALIRAALHSAGVAAARFSIVPFPLEEPQRWPLIVAPGTPQLVRVFSAWEREKARRFAAAGYPPHVLQGDPTRQMSATAVRAAMRCGAPWEHWVPPGARELLQQWQERAA